MRSAIRVFTRMMLSSLNTYRRSLPSSLQNDRSAKRRPQKRPNWKKRTVSPSLKSGPQTKRPRRGCSKEGEKSRGGSSTANLEEKARKTNPYELGEQDLTEDERNHRETRASSHYLLRSQAESRKEAATMSWEKR
ncbi:hypothetical protein TNCT_299711 [Trichonephila clavata]|uniref:Uncharacterized protein n=1 Tax=Trichonephila clavata TaxID=2740835 RepID=A0A8X6HXG2_TRICU|nr:hypothetical protein TNCT_299711 [Trichonephila clavata]